LFKNYFSHSSRGLTMQQVAAQLRTVAQSTISTKADKPPITRVNWKPDELALVLARVRQLQAEKPSMRLHVVARTAQQDVLPSERWRKFKQERDVEHFMAKALACAPEVTPAQSVPSDTEAVSAPLTAPAQAEAPPAPAAKVHAFPRAINPIPASEAAAQTAAASLPVQSPTPAPPEAPASANAADPAIVREVIAQLAPALAATLETCMKQLSGAMAALLQAAGTQAGIETGALTGAPAPRVPPPSRTRLPRVCVVGLINQQANDVAAAFEGAIEFIFVKSRQGGGGNSHGAPGMLTKGASADLVIAMTDWIDHDVQVASKHLHVPYEPVCGSVSALKRWLTDWLASGSKG
jgi:hypothetical protein